MPYQLQDVSILIVEDNKPMAQLTQSILLTFGFKNIDIAPNGQVGFEMFCSKNHDLVLSDWMMQPMDGITLTKLIRNNPKSPNQFVPIILVSGFSEKPRIFHARDTGVTEFLVKPFSARDLYRRVSHIIEKPRQYIRSEDFFGPDRRRIKDESYKGPKRRESDKKEDTNQDLGFDIGFSN